MNSPIPASAGRGQPRGFTLIELLVGLSVSSIVLVGVASAFVGINASYQSESKIKGAVENARNAQAYLERVVHLAGYGIDPRFGFDFSTANLGTYESKKDNFPALPTTFATDDLAFRYREPAYMRRGLSDTNGTQITLDATKAEPFGLPITTGQKFIVACPTGGEFAVVSAAANVGASAMTLITALDATISPTVPKCAQEGNDDAAPYVFLLYEVRIRVKEFNGQPYLVVFNSFANPDTAAFNPLAIGVENFQVSYIMNRPAGGSTFASMASPDNGFNKNWIIPDIVGENLLPDPTAAAPTYRTAYASANRLNLHPANIRGVRLTMVVRNLAETGQKYPRANVENQAAWGAVDGYFRTVITTTVMTPNMKSRALPIQSYKTGAVAADKDNLNVGGG